MHVGKVTGCYAGYIHQSLNKAEPTLALKPRGDVTRSPKQGYQWPQKWTCVQQKFKNKKKNPEGCDFHIIRHGKVLLSIYICGNFYLEIFSRSGLYFNICLFLQ